MIPALLHVPILPFRFDKKTCVFHFPHEAQVTLNALQLAAPGFSALSNPPPERALEPCPRDRFTIGPELADKTRHRINNPSSEGIISAFAGPRWLSESCSHHGDVFAVVLQFVLWFAGRTEVPHQLKYAST